MVADESLEFTQTGAELAQSIADVSKAIMMATKTAQTLKTTINIIGSIGSAFAVLGALASFVSAFLPDPVMLKLDEISGQITSLEY